jgi:ribonuclease III
VSLDALQARIGIAFRDAGLLREALTHSSFANESPQVSPRDNERLEYLGDAVLQLITAEYLFKLRPDAEEGEMTQVRSAMVNTNTLAALAEGLGLGDYLFLGKGIARGGGRNLKSLLANAFEAVLGAIFLDAGYDAAYHFYLGRFRALPEPVQDENHKGRLQQVVQERFGQTPYYDSASSRGGRHREYTAVVYAGPEPLGTGHGTNKQSAEQEAARQALLELDRREAAARKAAGSGRRSRRKPAAETPAPAPAAEPEPVVVPPPSPNGEEAPPEAAKKPRRRRRAQASEPGPEALPLPQPEPTAAIEPALDPEAAVAVPADDAGAPKRPRRRRKAAPEPPPEPPPEPALEWPPEPDAGYQ